MRILVYLACLCIMACLIFACATPGPEMVWVKKSGSTPSDFSRDKYDCLQQAQQRESSARGASCIGYYCDPGGAESRVVTNWNMYNACMEARDWRLQENRPAPAYERQRSDTQLDESAKQSLEVSRQSRENADQKRVLKVQEEEKGKRQKKLKEWTACVSSCWKKYHGSGEDGANECIRINCGTVD